MKTTLKTSKNILVEINIEILTANTANISFPGNEINFKNCGRETTSKNSFLFRNGKSNCISVKGNGIIDFNSAGGTALVIKGWDSFTFGFI